MYLKYENAALLKCTRETIDLGISFVDVAQTDHVNNITIPSIYASGGQVYSVLFQNECVI